MKTLVLMIALFAAPAFASDGTGTDNNAPNAADFFRQPNLPAKPDRGPFESADPDRKGEAMKYFTKGGRGQPQILKCAQYQSRSPWAFKAQCGLGYTAVQMYVHSSDVRHCYVGVACVPSDTSSNN